MQCFKKLLVWKIGFSQKGVAKVKLFPCPKIPMKTNYRFQRSHHMILYPTSGTRKANGQDLNFQKVKFYFCHTLLRKPILLHQLHCSSQTKSFKTLR